MELLYQKQLLRDFVGRVSEWPFEKLLKLQLEPATEDIGTPTTEAIQSYCSLEAELLQIIEPAVPRLLHVTVNAWGDNHSLGADLFIRENGTAEWDGRIYALVDGVPQMLDQ